MKRIKIIDQCRGVAIVLVVIGHLIQNNIDHYENLIFFNIIWSAQIPLFFFISGFLNSDVKLYKKICNSNVFYRNILEKIRSLLIPFLSFFFIIRFLILNEYNYDLFGAIERLSFKLEMSLWFLFALFIIQCLLIISCYVIRLCKINKNYILPFFIVLILTYVGVCIYIGGTSFLGAKFIGYYALFYTIGAVFYRYSIIDMIIKSSKLNDMILFFILIIYSVLINKFNLFIIEDNLLGIFIRLISGILIILIIIKIVNTVNFIFKDKLEVIGQYTLEIYASHLLFTNVLNSNLLPLSNPMSIIQLLINFIFMYIIMRVMIKIINSNKLLKLLFFGKK